ncbi:hypothetical protein [Synechococcus phage Ssp-JY39]|nr:hypothetical protein [Synechococcus phage Yong-M2-251]
MKIPKYAQAVPQNMLVRCICRNGCNLGATVFARVSDPNWSRNAGHEAKLYAECLKCGYRAHDNYNWLPA